MFHGLVVLFYLVFGIIAVRQRVLACAFVVFSLPLYVIRFTVGGLPTTFLEGMLLILFATWCAYRWRAVKELFKNHTSWCIVAGVFCVVSFIGIFVAPQMVPAFGLWRAYVLEPAVFSLVLLDTVRTQRHMMVLVCAVVASAGSIASIAIIQNVTGWNIPEPWTLERRATSIFPYPNAVGLFVAPVIGFACAYLAFVGQSIHGVLQRRRALAVWWVAIAVMFFGVIASKTEAAVVALAVSGFLFAFLWSAKARLYAWTVMAFCVGALVISPALSTAAQEKIFLKDWSGYVRKVTWQETWNMLKSRPFTGAGIGGYQTAMQDFHKKKAIEIFLYPHTFVLNVWSEFGLFGLGAFSALVALFYWQIRYALRMVYRAHNGEEHLWLRACTFGCMMAMTTILIHGLVDVPYFKNDLAVFFWMLLAFGCILFSRVRSYEVHA